MSTNKPYRPSARRWDVPTCCVPCKMDDQSDQVSALINNMPPDLWTLFLDQMYKPFLLRLATSDAKGRMPPSWIDVLPDRRPPKSLRQIFYDACALAHRNPAVEGTAARGVIVRMYSGTWLILQFMNKHGQMSPYTVSHLRTQMEMLTGNMEVMVHLNRCIRAYPFSWNPTAFARFTIRSGAHEFMLDVLERTIREPGSRPSIERRAKRFDMIQDRVQSVRDEIILLVDLIRAKRLAIAMALHKRLGGDSQMAVLSEELVIKCLVKSIPPALIRWDTIAQPWLV